MTSNKLNATGNELFAKLKGIRNTRDFVVGVMSMASHDDDRKVLLNYINKKADITPVEVIDAAVILSKMREGNKIFVDED